MNLFGNLQVIGVYQHAHISTKKQQQNLMTGLKA